VGIPKFNSKNHPENSSATPSTGSNRCPRCRYKKTVVAMKGTEHRFCTLCRVAWTRVYTTAKNREFWRYLAWKEKT
jgi:hypothetical protein